MGDAKAKGVNAFSVLLDVVLIAWCSYRLWQGRTGMGWKALLVAVIVLSTFSLFGKLLGRAGGGAERSAAEGIHKLQKGMYAGAHEYREVDDSALRGLDADFYARSTAAFKEIGFRQVGQIVDVTAERVTPWARAVIRCLLDASGTVMAGMYDVRFRSWFRGLQMIRVLPRDLRTIDLETELSNGQFVSTSNASQAALASEFAGVHRRFFSPDVPIPELVERHREFVGQVLAECVPEVRPIVHTNLREYRASQDRLQLLKSAHRASPDYDPGEEIARIQGRPLNEAEQRIAEHVRALRNKEPSE